MLRRGTHFSAGELSSLADAVANPLLKQTELKLLAELDAKCTPRLLKWARHIGNGVSDLVNFLDPQAMILGGNTKVVNQMFLYAMELAITESLVPLPQERDFHLIPAHSTLDCVAYGAGLSAIETFLLTTAASMED